MTQLYLDTTDYKGRRCIFTQEQVDLHIHKRPELRSPDFKGRIIRVLKQPDCVYPDYAERDRYVYYCLEYTVNNIDRYVKIVVQMSSTPCFIITAFRPTSIKEKIKGLKPLYER